MLNMYNASISPPPIGEQYYPALLIPSGVNHIYNTIHGYRNRSFFFDNTRLSKLHQPINIIIFTFEAIADIAESLIRFPFHLLNITVKTVFVVMTCFVSHKAKMEFFQAVSALYLDILSIKALFVQKPVFHSFINFLLKNLPQYPQRKYGHFFQATNTQLNVFETIKFMNDNIHALSPIPQKIAIALVGRILFLKDICESVIRLTIHIAQLACSFFAVVATFGLNLKARAQFLDNLFTCASHVYSIGLALTGMVIGKEVLFYYKKLIDQANVYEVNQIIIKKVTDSLRPLVDACKDNCAKNKVIFNFAAIEARVNNFAVEYRGSNFFKDTIDAYPSADMLKQSIISDLNTINTAIRNVQDCESYLSVAINLTEKIILYSNSINVVLKTHIEVISCLIVHFKTNFNTSYKNCLTLKSSEHFYKQLLKTYTASEEFLINFYNISNLIKEIEDRFPLVNKHQLKMMKNDLKKLESNIDQILSDSDVDIFEKPHFYPLIVEGTQLIDLLIQQARTLLQENYDSQLQLGQCQIRINSIRFTIYTRFKSYIKNNGQLCNYFSSLTDYLDSVYKDKSNQSLSLLKDIESSINKIANQVDAIVSVSNGAIFSKVQKLSKFPLITSLETCFQEVMQPLLSELYSCKYDSFEGCNLFDQLISLNKGFDYSLKAIIKIKRKLKTLKRNVTHLGNHSSTLERYYQQNISNNFFFKDLNVLKSQYNLCRKQFLDILNSNIITHQQLIDLLTPIDNSLLTCQESQKQIDSLLAIVASDSLTEPFDPPKIIKLEFFLQAELYEYCSKFVQLQASRHFLINIDNYQADLTLLDSINIGLNAVKDVEPLIENQSRCTEFFSGFDHILMRIECLAHVTIIFSSMGLLKNSCIDELIQMSSSLVNLFTDFVTNKDAFVLLYSIDVKSLKSQYKACIANEIIPLMLPLYEKITSSELFYNIPKEHQVLILSCNTLHADPEVQFFALLTIFQICSQMHFCTASKSEYLAQLDGIKKILATQSKSKKTVPLLTTYLDSSAFPILKEITTKSLLTIVATQIPDNQHHKSEIDS